MWFLVHHTSWTIHDNRYNEISVYLRRGFLQDGDGLQTKDATKNETLPILRTYPIENTLKMPISEPIYPVTCSPLEGDYSMNRCSR